jgi:outer membrane receptor protein involved in Fe transport
VIGDASLIPSLVLMGLGIGISTSPSQAAALSATPASQAGVAPGALSTLRYVGGVVGSGLVALIASGGLAHDARLIVFPAVLLASALVSLLLPGRVEAPLIRPPGTFSPLTLRDRGVENIEDVAANVAGFTVQNLGPGQSQVAMRGVSAGQIVRDQPGVKEQVGVYLDESVISLSLFTPDLDLFDLNRVEVLRGPQGTLFGSGSLSGHGALHHQPARDRRHETSASWRQHAPAAARRHVKLGVNVPLGDRRRCASRRTTPATAASSTPCSPTSA